MLRADPLTWECCFTLPLKLREIDLKETHGMPVDALAYAKRTDGGKSWEVRTDDHHRTLLGAFGFTGKGTIWSLWADLSLAQAREILDETAPWVDHMVFLSGREFLFNYVDVENRLAIKWLSLSGCFTIDKLHAYGINGRKVHYLRTKLRGAS